MKFLGGVGHGPGTNEFNFGDDPDHCPDAGVRSPKSGFTGLSKKYQWILLKFYGELGCGLETNWLHFGDDPDHRPDPGVRSPKSGFTGLSIMLAFGGGLCSLSTFSFHCYKDNTALFKLIICWRRYIFTCSDWIKVRADMSKRHAKTLKLDTVEESHLTAVQSTHCQTVFDLGIFCYWTVLSKC